ncbi:MAG: hypothetical protein JO015_20335 [Verrucomicrobia bacterium]|nr:hypothetical protein [Verrucomicrobiota bacterium]
MPKNRIQNCKNYVNGQAIFSQQGRGEAVRAFQRKCDEEQHDPGSELNTLIELPGNQNDKRWRDALRTLMLIEVFFFHDGRRRDNCISQIKQGYRSASTQSLENLITRQLNRVQRDLNRPAIKMLAWAAGKIRDEYDADMVPEFRNALRMVFTDSELDSVEPLYCFVWHKTPEAFQGRVAVLGGGACANPKAFTASSWTTPGELALPANYPPLDRGMEFPPEVHHKSMIHELLHWCTDPTYEQYTWDAYHTNADHRQIVREATTEWLTRNVTKDWHQGGYTNVYPYIERWINQNLISVADLKNAYFRGINAQPFADELVRLYQADVNWEGQKGQLNHLILTYKAATLAPAKVAPKGLARVLDNMKAVPETRWEQVTPPLSTWQFADAWKKKIRDHKGGG